MTDLDRIQRAERGHPVPHDPAQPAECGPGVWKLGTVEQVPVGEGRAFVVGDELVAVFRLRDGEVRAVSGRCPHRGGPLADGLIDGQQVICPLHNHAFRLTDGHCTTGEAPIRAHQISVEEGEIVLRLRSVN